MQGSKKQVYHILYIIYIRIYIYFYFLFDPSSAICHDLVDDGVRKRMLHFWEMPTMFASITQLRVEGN